jgi:AcrR family transcriptional regulator
MYDKLSLVTYLSRRVLSIEAQEVSKALILQRKPKGSGHERRAEILDAAQRILLRDGIERVTVRAIAAEIGTSSTALYVYFPTRDAILLSLCDRTMGELLIQFDALDATHANDLDKLKGFMAAYVLFGQTHPDAYRMVFSIKSQGIGAATHLEASPNEAAGNVGPQLFGRLLALVERLVAAGTFAARDPVAIAETIWMLGHGMIMLTVSMPQFPWKEPARAIEAATENLLAGLLKRA